MTFSIAHLQPIVALIAGILILIIPRLLNIIVAVYLILIGLLGWAFSADWIPGLRRALWRCF